MVCSDRLKELFDYNAVTGRLERKNPHNNEKITTSAISAQGYFIRKVDKTFYLEHRLVWMYHHGVFPNETDHINGIKTDNRIENLRDCCRTQNTWNQRKKQTLGGSSSTHKGVYFHRKSGKWAAQIVHFKVHYHLGLFATEGDAALAYKNKSLELFGEFAFLGRPSC
jgi:hypothetical protein